MTLKIENGDCIELMKNLPDKSVDLFICDLPYGETNCKWDIKIDMEEFWSEFKRIRKSKKVACIHFCSTQFGYTLIKSWEKGFKMDMVWKKRNKTGGLQSRHRPMRNHEMVYFFYEQAPKYNRDKYHKRIQQAKIDKTDGKNGHGFEKNIESGLSKKHKTNFDPPNPTSVLEEDPNVNEDGKSAHGWDIKHMNKPRVAHFEPKLPASVLEEEVQKKEGRKKYKNTIMGDMYLKKEVGAVYEPPNPASVFDSQKVFIGKRHHQTEKPQDILEFFLKYWTDEGDTILDPTMGSGSTGVACKTLKRNFIGFELNEKIYKVAQTRLGLESKK